MIVEKNRFKQILNNAKGIKIGVIGDICLDIYWKADMTKSELSRETPHFPLPIVEERVYAGAGGNVLANIVALDVEKTYIVSTIGNDWRGDLLKQNLDELGVDTTYLLTNEGGFTNAYCKPIKWGLGETGCEDNRIDFAQAYIPQELEDKILQNLDQVICKVDVLCVCDQFKTGCITPRIRERINEYAKQGFTIFIDSRDNISKYQGGILKPNEIEAYRAVYGSDPTLEIEEEDYCKVIQRLAINNQATVCMTLGDKGCMLSKGKEIQVIPTTKVTGEIDICGAGDTFLASLAVNKAAGASLEEAAWMACIASSVTIQKLGQCGTAKPNEMINRYIEIVKEDCCESICRKDI